MKLISKIKGKNRLTLALLADIIIFVASFSVSYLIDSINIGIEHNAEFGIVMLLCLPCAFTTITVMYFLRMYKIMWQYAGTLELIKIIFVAALSLALGILYRGLFALAGPFYNVHLSLVIIAYMLFFLLAITYRIFAKIIAGVKHRLRIQSSSFGKMERVIVYGAGYTGAALVKRMLNNPKDGYLPVAIIDDDLDKKGTTIGGLNIVGDRTVLSETVEKYKADIIAIAITMLTKKELRSIFDYIKQFNTRIMITNNFKDASSEINSDIISIRNIKIEDLLHRDEHTMNRELVDSVIKNKVVMVTGGAGSIGSELCRQALFYGCKKLVIFDQSENGMFEFNEELKKLYPNEKYVLEIGTVRDRTKLRSVIEKHKPNIVFHAAAYKHVPMMEISCDESIKNNILGTKNVIEQCNESGVSKFILISTDKAINPANIMGATKRLAELVLQHCSKYAKTQLAAVRFGNVLGSSGSVIPTFIKQINEGGPITVTDKDMKRYFMTIPEAVRLVLQAGAMAQGGEVFVLDMGEPVYIYDLAKDLILMSGLVPDKDIEIKISGLRPGEKLFEELQYGDENVDKTRHKDIFVCKLADSDDDICQKVDEILAVAGTGDKEGAEKMLFDLVPSEYRQISKNSSVRI